MAAKQDRIMLWGTPRSISSAFFRAMVNRPKTKGFMEPFYHAYYLGSERMSKRFDGISPIQENSTFLDMKKQCEQEYPGYAMVFVKDQAHRFQNRMKVEYLPEGFKHTFILRHPREAITSLYKNEMTLGVEGWQHFEPVEARYMELYDIFKLVTEQLGQKAIIVEAKDLLEHPHEMLRMYCEKVGISFDRRMLNWSTEQEDLEVFQYHLPWFKDLLSETTFRPYKPKPPMELPEEVEAAIAENIPFYEKLYQHRLQLNV